MLEDRSYMRDPEFKTRPAISMTVLVLLVNLIVFIGQQIHAAYIGVPVAGPPAYFKYLALSIAGISKGYVWQFLTFQFLHGGLLHFFFNMLGLWFFGRPVEAALGQKHFLRLYLGCGVVGGLLQTLLGFVVPSVFGIPVVGASAGVFGLVAAFARLDPEQQILINFFLPLKAKYYLWIATAVAVFYILVPADRGVAHGAHLGGIIGGVAYIHFVVRGGLNFRFWNALRPRRRPKPLLKIRFPKSSALERERLGRREDQGPTDFISKEVDPILEKISAHGIHSLTEHERKILEAARARMEKR